MNEKIMKAMVATGVVKKIDIVARGGHFYIEASTPNGPVTAETQKGKVKTWVESKRSNALQPSAELEALIAEISRMFNEVRRLNLFRSLFPDYEIPSKWTS